MSYFGYTNYGDQRLLINNQFVSGVQSISTTTSTNQEPIYIAGIGVLKYQTNKAIVPNFTFEQIVSDKDIMPTFITGNSMLNGLFQQRNNFLEFSSGYIGNYNLSCRVGELIRASTSINCYGKYEYVSNTGQFSPYLISSGNAIHIPDYSSISIGLGDALIDRVVAFNLDVKFNNTPIYAIGSIVPKTIKLQLPIEVTVAFDLEIDEAQLKTFSETLCANYKDNTSIFVNTKCTNYNIFSFVISGAELKSQRYNGKIGNNASVTFEYVKHFNSLPLFSTESEALQTPIGRIVLSDADYPDRTIPLSSRITKIDTYTITGNTNF